MEPRELTFEVTPEKGTVSALLHLPEDADSLLVLGHGAGAGMRHRNLEAIAARLAALRIGTLRYQFPFMERGGGRDSEAVSLATVRRAVEEARRHAQHRRLLAGGQSFGGRMTSLAAARPEGDDDPTRALAGLVYFNFPLHPPGRPGTKRAGHLGAIAQPQLFLAGTRDPLAHLDLLRPVVDGIGPSARLHLIDTADHSFKVLKRTRQSPEDPIDEACRVVRDWLDSILLPK